MDESALLVTIVGRCYFGILRYLASLIKVKFLDLFASVSVQYNLMKLLRFSYYKLIFRIRV